MHKERLLKLVDHLDYGELGHKVIDDHPEAATRTEDACREGDHRCQLTTPN